MKSISNNFSLFLKNLSKTVDEKQKKDKSGSRKQRDYSAEYAQLEKHIVDIKQVKYDHVHCLYTITSLMPKAMCKSKYFHMFWHDC